MKLIFFGSGEFGIPTLQALCDVHGSATIPAHEIALVVTQPDRRAGRGKRTTPTPVRSWCDANGVSAIPVENVNESGVVGRLLETGARIGVVVAFGQKIGPEILSGLPGGCINLHASLLPRYRGASPINQAILNGDSISGVTVFKLVERMDAGNVLTRADLPIGPRETAGELHDRLAALGPRAVLDALKLFESDTVPVGDPQDEADVTKAPKLKKEDGEIDWSQSAERVARLIHGMCPWPGATTTFNSAQTGKSEPVTILRAQPLESGSIGSPGRLTDTRADDHGLCVACGTGSLAILEIKPAGSRTMSWRDFVNGRHVTPEDRFLPSPGGGPTPPV